MFVAAWLLASAVLLVSYYGRLIQLVRLRSWDPALVRGGASALVLSLAVGTLAAVVWRWASSRRILWSRSWLLRAALALTAFFSVIAVASSNADLWQVFGIRAAPYLGEAIARASRAATGAALVLVAGLVAGGVLVSRTMWLDRRRSEWLLVQLVPGLALISYSGLALAWFGAYRPRILIALSIAIGSAGAIAALFCRTTSTESGVRSDPSETVRPAERGMSGRSASAFSPYASHRELVFLTIAAAACFVCLIQALAPETEFDALWYHLWLPVRWLSTGHPFDDVREYISLYPLGWEMLYGAAMSLGGPVAAKLLHFACLPLLALACGTIARRLLPSASPVTTMAIVVTVPTVMWEAGTAYIDLALALSLTVAAWALAEFLESAERRWFILAVINLGFAVCIKHLGLVFVAVSAVALLILMRTGTRAWRRPLAYSALLVIIPLVLASPWYARAWEASANPFFPEMYKVFGASPPERWDPTAERELDRFKARFGRTRTPLHLAALPVDITVHAARYGGDPGPVLLMLVPLLLLRPGAGHRPEDRGRLCPVPCALFVIIVFGYLAVWASPLGSFQLRFLVPIAPLVACLASEGEGRLRARLTHRPARGLWTAALAMLLVLNFPWFAPLREPDRIGDNGWLTHVMRSVPFGVVSGRQSADRYISSKLPSFAVWKFINSHLPADARVLTFSEGDQLYAERDRIWADAPVARAAVWEPRPGEEEQARQALRRLGVTHILVDRWAIDRLPPASVAIVGPTFTARCMREEYRDARFELYRVVCR